jgi:LysM repeat protein
MNRQLSKSGTRRRALPVGAGGKAARYVAPAVFLLAVTGVVLLVRSTLRSDKPAAATTSMLTARTATTPTPTVSRPSPLKQYYVITSGDTLDAIASRFATSVDAMLRLNPGIEPTALRPGEQVRVK